MLSFDDPQFALNLRLVNAIRAGDLTACEAALDEGADPNDDITNVGQGMLYRAIESGFLEGVRLLLDRGASLGAARSRNQPIAKAAQMGALEIIEALLDKGADVNARDVGGDTALHFAARFTHIATVKMLLSKGAEVQATNNYHLTPLHEAALTTSDETEATLRILVQAGASPRFVPALSPTYYRTPTQQAAFAQRHSALSFFLDVCGEDPDQRTVAGKSLLSIAGDWATKQLVLSALTARAAAIDSVGNDTLEPANGNASRPNLGPL
jgi:ankyrin repeat protein